MAGIRVTAEDLATGERSIVVLQPGNYCVVTADPCYLAHEQHHANGTTVLTLKGRRVDLMAVTEIAPGGGGG